jgi:hypothetical protein
MTIPNRTNWKRLLTLLVLTTLTVLIGGLRYTSWIDAVELDHHIGVPGWTTPWLGPLSLLAVCMLFAAVIIAFLSRDRLAGLLAAAAGWLTSFLAALAVIITNTIGKLGVEIPLPQDIERYAPEFRTTPYVWITFFAGLAAAGVGAVLVFTSPGGARP